MLVLRLTFTKHIVTAITNPNWITETHFQDWEFHRGTTSAKHSPTFATMMLKTIQNFIWESKEKSRFVLTKNQTELTLLLTAVKRTLHAMQFFVSWSCTHARITQAAVWSAPHVIPSTVLYARDSTKAGTGLKTIQTVRQ